jgi:hypothetical protein
MFLAMARREAAGKGLTVAGVPVRASPAFVAVAVFLGDFMLRAGVADALIG